MINKELMKQLRKHKIAEFETYNEIIQRTLDHFEGDDKLKKEDE